MEKGAKLTAAQIDTVERYMLASACKHAVSIARKFREDATLGTITFGDQFVLDVRVVIETDAINWDGALIETATREIERASTSGEM